MGFQERVWELMKRVPEGKVTTYKILAEKLETKGYRTVGNACHNNPYFPEVPCHRVVNSDGGIGGFARGKEKKIKLLQKEGVKIENGKIKNLEEFLHKF